MCLELSENSTYVLTAFSLKANKEGDDISPNLEIKILRVTEKLNSFRCTHKIWVCCLPVCLFVYLFDVVLIEGLGMQPRV